MKKTVFVLLLGITAALQNAAASEVCRGQVCFAEELPVSGSLLKLKGAKLFEYLIFDVYTAAFYAPESAEGITDALSGVPKSLILHYHRNIRPEDMNKAAEKMLRKNPAVDFEAIEERFDLLARTYSRVGKGDRYELRYEPGRGTTLFLNGKEQVTVAGEDFAKAYFGIWLSEVPINRELRDALLGA